ncbi:hypothetical protein COX24_02215, partial [bacterium (Candidatus Gribaldobacteria) CG23_combo_of_CG06-09_8_20_14_all_37_87_8]
DDIKCLQALLNQSADTQVAASGVGSSGNETSYFGALTKAAVVKFQEKYAADVLAVYGLTSGTGFVGTTTRAKLNTLLAAPAEEVPAEEVPAEEVPAEEVPAEEVVAPAEGLAIALAADTPAATIVPLSSTNVEYIKVNLTASSDADVTISQMVFTRKGVGSASDFDNVYLYENDNRLTSGRTISSTTQQATFTNLGLKVKAGKTRTISLVAEMAAATAGDVNYFQITASSDITSDATTVSGAFPIAGNSMVLGAQSAGTLTIATSGTPSNPYVGSSQAEVSRFQLTAGANEDVLVKRIILTNGGSVASTVLTNFKLYRGSTLLAEAEGMSNDRVSLTLTDGYTLLKGENRTFSIKADIAGRPDQTIKLYIDYNTDVYGIGKTYGGGAGVTNSFTSSLAPELTLQGGAITISMTGPAAGKMQTTAQDVVMMEYTMTATQDVEVRSTTLYLCWDDTGDGTYNNMTAAVKDDITDVKIINAEIGGAVAGPTDGSGFSLTSTTTVCGATGAYKTWSDYYDINEESPLKLKVTLDLTASDIADTDKIKVVLGTFGASTIKSRITNDYIATTDIVPGSNIAANAMTVQAADLTVALASTPVSGTYITGAKNKELVGFTITAAEASDIEVNTIKVTAYVNKDTSGTFTKDTDGTITAKNLVDSLYLYDGTIAVAGPKSIDSDGYITFTNMSWIVSAGVSKKLVLKGDVTTNAPEEGISDRIKFDIADVSADITCYDPEGRSVTSSGTDAVNGGTADSGIKITLASAGTLWIEASADTPDSDIILMDTTGVTMAKVKFTAVYEGFTVKKIRLDNANSAYDDEITKVTISYLDANNATVTQDSYLSGGSVDFTGMTMYIPKDSARILTVLANINSLSGGADSGDKPKLSFSLDITDDDEFEAVSDSSVTIKDSGVYLDGAANANETIANINDMYVRMTKPTVTLDSAVSGKLNNGVVTLVKFTVAAASGNNVALKKLSFDLAVNDITTAGTLTLSAVKIYRSTALGTALTAVVSDNATTTTPTWTNGSGKTINLMFGSAASGEEVIPAGGSRTYYLKGTVASAGSDTNGNDSITISLKSPDTTAAQNTTGGLDTATNSATTLVEVDDAGTTYACYYVWSDNSQSVLHSSADQTTYKDWTNGYLVNGLPSDSVNLVY